MDFNNEPLPQFMTISEVAKRLNVSDRTVHRYIRDEKNPLPVVYLTDRTPRIPYNQFEIWIKEHTEISFKMKGGD